MNRNYTQLQAAKPLGTVTFNYRPRQFRCRRTASCISAQNPPHLCYKDERGMVFFEMVKNVNALVADALNTLVEKGAKVITIPPIDIVGAKAEIKDALTAQAVVSWLKDNGDKINRLIIVDNRSLTKSAKS